MLTEVKIIILWFSFLLLGCNCASTPVTVELRNDITGAIHGNLFTITLEGSVFVTTLDAATHQAALHQYHIASGNNDNDTVNLRINEGSGDESLSPPDNQLIYAVLHNHVYIAMDTSVLVVNLNISNPPYLSYDTLDIGHTPTAVKAFTLNGGDPFVAVTYTTDNEREYLRRYRKYDNRVWGFYGEPVLVVTPHWYNLTLVSNTLIYQAAESLSTFVTSVWVGVAQGWYIYATDLVDGTTRTFATPEPCDNIQRLVHSQHRQRMLVQCAEATVFFDTEEKEFYKLWVDAIGTVFIAPSGKYGAVVNASGTGLTVLHLHGDYQSLSVAVEGVIQDVLFVDAGKSLHYLCYVEKLDEEFAVNCLNIEQLNSTQNAALLFRGRTKLPPTLYTHRNLLTVQHTAAADCPQVQVYDMISLTNTHNLTNVNPALIAFKPLPPPPTITPTTDDITTTSTPPPPTRSTHIPHTPHSTTVVTTTTTDQLCTVELERARGDYQRLLLGTTIVCSLFCVILLVTTVVLAVVLYYTKVQSSAKTTSNKQPELTDIKQT